MKGKVGIGGLLEETVSLIGDGIAFLAAFVVVVAGLTATSQIGGAVDPERVWGFGFTLGDRTTAWGAAAAIVATVVQFVGSYLVIERLLELRDSLFATGTRIWAYVGLTILTTLGMMFGLLLLIVPGLILAVRWSAAPAYLIARGTGVFEAMRLSWDTTKGAGWSIFLAGLVLICAIGFLALVVGGMSEMLAGDFWLAAVAGSLIETAGTAAFLVFGVAVFLHVDDGEERIEQVFA